MTSTVETDLEKGVLHNTEWVRRWEIGDTSFHQSCYNPLLDQFEERMFGGRTKSVFAPLCGKALDLPWMYERGHTVVGVEIAEKAVKELFEENKIEYTVTELEHVGKLYKSKDNRLQVYAADLFAMSVALCGQFDVIWDSKSLVAINMKDRDRYVQLMLSLMKKDGGYYLETIVYDPSKFPGPPHSMSEEVIRNLFEKCHVELLDESDYTNKTLISEAALANSSPEHRALMTSPYLYIRWYNMKVK